jgi:Lrp/AsnC family transcriptional regulator for asnA, asnC and gidA
MPRPSRVDTDRPADPAAPDPLKVAIEMSELDRAVIRALQADGRRPYSRMAEDLGIAEKTVRRRVQELRDSGVIEITTVTDPELLGFEAMALVGVRLEAGVAAAGVAAEIARLDAVDYVVVTTGRWNLFVEIVCRNSGELLRAVESGIAAATGVREAEIFPYLRFHYQEPRWEAAKRKSSAGGVNRRALALDDLDRAILLELNTDGRAPLQRIARTLAVPLSQVRQRVGAMVDSGAVRIMAITNPTSLGFTTMAWLAITAAPDIRVSELADSLLALPSIAYVVICAGQFDIFAETICVDRADLLRVLDEEVRSLSGIAALETFVYLELHYKRLRPDLGLVRQELPA